MATKDEIGLLPVYKIITAIFNQASKDFGDKNHNQDVKDFIESHWFINLAENLGDPAIVLEKIMNGDFQEIKPWSDY